ncbi:MAG: DegT/DnrJ/EryC1/StrS family aminotransferase [Lachnospiraceae bacterium]|nr:DegT/DnrJ/EryC1/StrS family aminotransferase [Lachnospiraceae bacterium]
MQFRDLQKQYEVLKDEIDSNIRKVCQAAHFISGSEVTALERQLAEYVGVKHCITCANGTDAITLAIKAWGLGEGDAVFVPDFTFFSSGECPAGEGCTCVFVDVDPKTYNIDPDKLEEAINKTTKDGRYTPKAVVAVDLFGQPAEYDRIQAICRKYDLLLLEDGAQGFGGEINGKKACSFGDISTTSFFPAKPLGCYGDGGAVFTDNDEWAALIRSYAVHGKSGNDKYNNIRIGLNSRLDTIQAAILQVKLKAFADHELDDINAVAKMYMDEFAKRDPGAKIALPTIKEGYLSSWAQFTIQLPEGCDRAAFQKSLKDIDIPTMVYYMKPMHTQGAFAGTYSEESVCPVTDGICNRVLSLPIHPYMTGEQVQTVVESICSKI